jgi:hypothetical protein
MDTYMEAAGVSTTPMEEEFAQHFAEIWKHPSAERLVTLLHPEVILYQPNGPPIHGRLAARAEFERLLRWLPGLYGVVERSVGAGGVVFIESQMNFPIGRRGVRIRTIDRFVLQDGLAIERAVYFNPLQLLTAILAHPAAWWGFVRYRFMGRRQRPGDRPQLADR